MKTTIFLLFALMGSSELHGQEELILYKKLYRTADSLKAIGQILAVDKVSVFKRARQLDKGHPAGFFEAIGEFVVKSEFNESAVLFYIGVMRFRYYNSANPNYQPSGDGALLASLQYTIGETINMYLRTDVDNFASIIKLTIEYCKTHDFDFFPKKRDIEKYNAQIQSFNGLVEELEKNKIQYEEQWLIERKNMEEYIDRAIKEQKDKKN